MKCSIFAVDRSRGETTRMFVSDFFERFSRIHPATPFVVWLPVILFVLHRSWARHDLDVSATAGAFLLAVFAWTFVEYVLHRFVFHWMGKAPFGKRVHFLIHGVHHSYPHDEDRLVMPLAVSVPLGTLFYALFFSAMGPRIGDPFFAGFVLGYLGYDGAHYTIHHFQMRGRIGRRLKRHHMLHHHADNDGGFGVSTPLWDLVFRTMPRLRGVRTE